MNETASQLRSELCKTVEGCTGKDVAVLLSSGTDSMSILFALLEVGAYPHTYSFFMEGCENLFDPFVAQRNSDTLGVPWTPFPLPYIPERAACRSVFGLGYNKKTDIECAWPVAEIIQWIPEQIIFSGHAGDGHFGLTKKVQLHKELIFSERRACFSNPDYAQVATLRWFASCLEKSFRTPWTSQAIINLLDPFDWEQLNRPREKEVARAAFEREFMRCPAKKHCDLHSKGTGIKAMFDVLTEGTRFKNNIGVYNRMMNKERTILIGEVNPFSGIENEKRALSEPSISRPLCKRLDCDLLTFLSSFERRVVDPTDTDRVNELHMLYTLGRRILFINKAVAKVFGFEAPPLQWTQNKTLMMAILPDEATQEGKSSKQTRISSFLQDELKGARDYEQGLRGRISRW